MGIGGAGSADRLWIDAGSFVGDVCASSDHSRPAANRTTVANLTVANEIGWNKPAGNADPASFRDRCANLAPAASDGGAADRHPHVAANTSSI
jgi:hypothetical protein